MVKSHSPGGTLTRLICTDHRWWVCGTKQQTKSILQGGQNIEPHFLVCMMLITLSVSKTGLVVF